MFMSEFSEPIKFEDGASLLSQQDIVGGRLRSKEWLNASGKLRNAAFYSAGVEDVRVLQKMRNLMVDFLAGNRIDTPTGSALKVGGRSEFIKQMLEFMEVNNIAHTGKKGTIRDIRSSKRLKLIFDTKTRQVNKLSQEIEGNEAVLLNAFPARRFFRQAKVKVVRIRHENNLEAVRRKDDTDFWLYLNASDIGGFQVPYGPWGFNTGTDDEDVPRDEAERLGLVREGEILTVKQPSFDDLNSASVKTLDEDMKRVAEKKTKGKISEPDGILKAGNVSAQPLISPTAIPKIASGVMPSKPELLEMSSRAGLLNLELRDKFESLPKKVRQSVPATIEFSSGVPEYNYLTVNVKDLKSDTTGSVFRKLYGHHVNNITGMATGVSVRKEFADIFEFEKMRIGEANLVPNWFVEWGKAGSSYKLLPETEPLLEKMGVFKVLSKSKYYELISVMGSVQALTDGKLGIGVPDVYTLNRTNSKYMQFFSYLFFGATGKSGNLIAELYPESVEWMKGVINVL